MTASFFGLGATLSNFLGQLVVEKFGHVTSLVASLILSFFPILLFAFMPETLGQRGYHYHHPKERNKGDVEVDTAYQPMS
jgi:hypothetical protein